MKLFFLAILICLISCSDSGEQEKHFHPLEGQTMGTSYHIIFEDVKESKISNLQVDSLLEAINQSVSTYIPSSIISRLNEGDTVIVAQENSFETDFFMKNIKIAKKVFDWTNGYFDPTVMPLVNYWGFGYTKRNPVENIDSAHIDSLMSGIGFQKIYPLFSRPIWHLPDETEIDFSAIAKGAAVDEISQFLINKNINNFLVEIGGETYTRGPGRNGEGWVIGINTPVERAATNDIFDKILISEKAIATSGNYRNFYEVNGQKYAHTVNPKTGYFEQRDVISATIVADDCATADALATAMIASGLQFSKDILANLPAEIEGYLLYNNGSDSLLIYQTKGMDQFK